MRAGFPLLAPVPSLRPLLALRRLQERKQVVQWVRQQAQGLWRAQQVLQQQQK